MHGPTNELMRELIFKNVRVWNFLAQIDDAFFWFLNSVTGKLRAAFADVFGISIPLPLFEILLKSSEIFHGEKKTNKS